jgi:hypothetical protein
MAAMVIHRVKDGGKIRLYVYGGPAPESEHESVRVRFRGARAGCCWQQERRGTRKNGKLVEIPGRTCSTGIGQCRSRWKGSGSHGGYPNRDSLPYAETYGITTARTMFRGTLRYPGWCATIKKFVELGLFDEAERDDLAGLTFAQFTAKLAGAEGATDLKADLARRLGVAPDSFIIGNMDGWGC